MVLANKHEDRRCSCPRLRDAADQPSVSAWPLSLRRSRISHHYLPDRQGGSRRGGARAADVQRTPREVRVYPDAEFHGLWRLHEVGPGHSGNVQGARRRLHPRHVPERRATDFWRPRAMGLSEEVCAALARARQGHADRHARLWTGACSHRHDGIQASGSRFEDRGCVPCQAELSPEDHSACGR